MSIIEVNYGGQTYTIRGRELADVVGEIETALANGVGWLEAYDGHGSREPARLLISPGVNVSVLPLPGWPED